MNPATHPRGDTLADRLLVVDPRRCTLRDARVGALGSYLRAGDLLVVNDAATLPASLRATAPSGAAMEVRLAGERSPGRWTVVLFGAGDWRTPTEYRPAPEAVCPGDSLRFGEGLAATVVSVTALSPRLVDLRFDREGAALWSALYRLGRPVQYSYLEADLSLWDVQTAYAARPWAVEMPSAGRPLRGSLLADLVASGVRLAAVTHAAGLSSTGDPRIDAALPLPERFEVPAATRAAVRATRARGGRVVAVGTSVVRALTAAEGAPGEGTVAGVAEVIVRPGDRPVVDGLLTGMHSPGTSHHDLLAAFVPHGLLRAADAHAADAGYLAHEFGDSCLVLAA